MIIQARIANTEQVFVVWLPFDGVAGQGRFPIFQRQRVLKNIDQRLFACQSLLSIEQEIAEPGVACPRQRSRLTDGRKRPIYQLWLRLHPFDPAEHSSRKMASIISLFIGQVFLKIVILVPLLMGSKQIFPRVRFLERPVGHTSLDINKVYLS